MTSFHSDHPDMSGGLVQFTGRTGAANPNAPAVEDLPAEERLEAIMNGRRILGFESFTQADREVATGAVQGISHRLAAGQGSSVTRAPPPEPSP